MVKVLRYFEMVINMKVITKMVNLTEQEDTNGNKVNTIKVNFLMGYVKVMVDGLMQMDQYTKVYMLIFSTG
jgi:hypothetical protein